MGKAPFPELQEWLVSGGEGLGDQDLLETDGEFHKRHMLLGDGWVGSGLWI